MSTEIYLKVSNGFRVQFNCNYCGKIAHDKLSHYKRKKRHYCNQSCYSNDKKENWKKEEMQAWKGGVSSYESHKRWKKKNPERMSHLKARYYARRKNAEGSHTFEEWKNIKAKYKNKCAQCRKDKPLTKDHIRPLSKGGSDYIENIQPLCRNCNSRKNNIRAINKFYA